MRGIAKGAEPRSLTVHRRTPHCSYDNYEDKDALRHALVTEQGGICCYCMGRIHNGPLTMKIEHWRSQYNYPDEQLNYRNLLGACLGGQGRPKHHQHCDTKKADKDVEFNPAEPAHRIETRISYQVDGSICSDHAVFDDQLNIDLNLNLPALKNNRKAILDAVLDWWKAEKRRIHGPVPRHRLIEKRDRYRNNVGQLQPYCQVAVWWLEQRLARMAG